MRSPCNSPVALKEVKLNSIRTTGLAIDEDKRQNATFDSSLGTLPHEPLRTISSLVMPMSWLTGRRVEQSVMN